MASVQGRHLHVQCDTWIDDEDRSSVAKLGPWWNHPLHWFVGDILKDEEVYLDEHNKVRIVTGTRQDNITI